MVIAGGCLANIIRTKGIQSQHFLPTQTCELTSAGCREREFESEEDIINKRKNYIFIFILLVSFTIDIFGKIKYICTIYVLG